MSTFLAKRQESVTGQKYCQYKLAHDVKTACRLLDEGFDVYRIKDPASAAGKPVLRKLTSQTVSKQRSITELLDGDEVIGTSG